MQGLFITGTDTGVGKTLVSCSLLEYFNQRGHSTLGLKPVAAGCDSTAQGLRNEDAVAMMQSSSVKLPYADINPYAFEPAIAPHLAAEDAGVCLDAEVLSQYCHSMESRADKLIIEGAGGWKVPLNTHEGFDNLARKLEISVVLVVGIKLGCINHALLTVEAISFSGLKLEGWVANCCDPDAERVAENILTLEQKIAEPKLATLPFCETPLPKEMVQYFCL
ncbi:dethiobiotin synthase [Pelagibaculum spongiae]|uniref:ATP-dependent dethiobiotin synthetase BioD n=1 Tax=Pelagibaculum spongiae TaxID=2080658 RepID=A0A2V1GNF4_9GAMM|nr:dethiobiotin synthase [Pelagibaculum spongiae]PVZ63461.1 dethiobiotin synthase [Pelagibaculum spongiae]